MKVTVFQNLVAVKIVSTFKTVNENIPESTIALEVLSSMAENESFDEIDFGNEGQDLFDNMMEDAVLSAVDSEEGAEMLAVIIVKSDTDIAGTMLDYISEVSSEDPNSTLVAEVLSSVSRSISSLAIAYTFYET